VLLQKLSKYNSYKNFKLSGKSNATTVTKPTVQALELEDFFNLLRQKIILRKLGDFIAGTRKIFVHIFRYFKIENYSN